MPSKPHERFIVGQGESGRMYVVHTHTPRFVAELFDEDDEHSVHFALHLPESGEVLANFVWIDRAEGVDLDALRQAVADFLAEGDFRAEREIAAARRAEEEEDDHDN
jgi:hypothetical protein